MNIEQKKKLAECLEIKHDEDVIIHSSFLHVTIWDEWNPNTNYEQFINVLQKVKEKGLKAAVYADLVEHELPEEIIPQNMGFFDTILFGYNHKDKIIQSILNVLNIKE